MNPNTNRFKKNIAYYLSIIKVLYLGVSLQSVKSQKNIPIFMKILLICLLISPIL